MKILIIGPLGAGKSSLAYAINKKFNIPRLNLDEVCRHPENGNYYPLETQFTKLDTFLQTHSNWVAEGCQKYLYEKTKPDLIIDMRINRFIAMYRFTTRFIKAQKLLGQKIDKDLPVQPYHYRKITFKKINEYNRINQEINAEIALFLSNTAIPVLTCKTFKNYEKIFTYIKTKTCHPCWRQPHS